LDFKKSEIVSIPHKASSDEGPKLGEAVLKGDDWVNLLRHTSDDKNVIFLSHCKLQVPSNCF